jgi:ATP-dependent DNA helicase RecQ
MGTLGKAVAEAKAGGHPPPAGLVPAALDALRKQPLSFSPEVVVYIPPTRSGEFVKRFAEDLARRLGVPAVALRKGRTTSPQKSFSAKHNKEKNVKGAFIADAGTLGQVRVLLVDDIWDSGATLREAARLLKTPGRDVRPLTMARTRHADDQ